MRAGLAALLLIAGALLGWGVARHIDDPDRHRPADVATVAAASLRSVQREARLTVFAARFVVAVTSEHRTLGIAQTKTMIVPGIVRYEIDWSRLTPAALAWNAAARTLRVDLPALEIAGPQVELTRAKEYEQGHFIMALTGSEPALDAANRARISTEMLGEARAPELLRLARDAARAEAVRSFALPLAAAGIDAHVEVRFPGEA